MEMARRSLEDGLYGSTSLASPLVTSFGVLTGEEESLFSTEVCSSLCGLNAVDAELVFETWDHPAWATNAQNIASTRQVIVQTKVPGLGKRRYRIFRSLGIPLWGGPMAGDVRNLSPSC